MKFNARQIDGFTKFLDTMTASAFAGALVGASGHTPMTTLLEAATALRSER